MKKLNKLRELRDKKIGELRTEHLALLREFFNLKMQKGTGQLTQIHLLKKVRRTIAQVLTVINEKQRYGHE